MPIDPNIVAGLRPVQFQLPDPMEQYGKSLTLKNLMMQGDQAQRGIDDENAQREALMASAGDNKRYRELLANRGQHKAVQALDKFQLESDEKRARIGKEVAETDKTKYDIEIDRINRRSSILSTATDQASWDAARRVVALNEPDIAGQLPAQFDPALLKARLAQGQTLVQRLSDLRTQEAHVETGRHNKATEGNSAATLAETARHNKYTEENPGLQHIETPDGIAAFNTRTGTAAPVLGADGKPLQGGKALTESQGKATGMALRAQKAHDALLTLEDAGTKTGGIIKQGVEGVPLIGGALGMGVNSLPSWAGGPSAPQQQVEQAQRDFVNAALRVESGASISQSEFDNARKQYFTQPGDSPEVIAQKKRNRETEIESLKLQAGSGSKNVVAQARPTKPLGGSDMAKAPVNVQKLSDAELLSELGIKR